MTSLITAPARILLTAFVLTFLPFSLCNGATAPFELDIKDLEKAAPPQPKKPVVKQRHTSPSAAKKKPLHRTSAPAGHVKYTVKPGDHIFKILVKGFGLSNTEAERLIPDVARINNIDNIRNLSIGQTLLIPSAKHQSSKQRHSAPTERHAGKRPHRDAQSLATKVEQPTPPPPAQEPPEAVPAPAAPAAKLLLNVYEIPSGNAEEMIDGLLKALSIDAQKKQAINAAIGKGGGNTISIKVDRYFEEGGKRIIINCSPKDHFNYTLLRLLETEGYSVIYADNGDFKKVAGTLLLHLNRQHVYVVRKSETSGREQAGYLLGDGKSEQQVFLTDTSAPL